jgi:hypothetical protein
MDRSKIADWVTIITGIVTVIQLLAAYLLKFPDNSGIESRNMILGIALVGIFSIIVWLFCFSIMVRSNIKLKELQWIDGDGYKAITAILAGALFLCISAIIIELLLKPSIESYTFFLLIYPAFWLFTVMGWHWL